MENQTVTHITQNGKYRIVFERAASTKGTIGYKVEANGDDKTELILDIETLKADAEKIAGPPVAEARKGE